jgi:hypothetical protein
MKKYILIVSLLIALLSVGRLTEGEGKSIEVSTNDGCKCYANGSAFSPGYWTCLGGFKAVCVARYGVGEEARECGWDYVTDGNGDYIRCQ